MTTDNLSDILGLSEAPSGAGEAIGIEGGNVEPTEPPSETALELDAWSLRRGREVLEESERIAKALQSTDPKLDRRAMSEKATLEDRKRYTKDQTERRSRAYLAAADLFAAAFEPEPRLVERCTDEVRHRFLTQLFETPEARVLRESTVLDEVSSEIACAAFAEQYAALRVEEEKAERERGDGKGGGKEDPMAGEMRGMRAVAKALQKASTEVKDEQDARDAFGMGEGTAGGKMDHRKVAEIFKRVRNDPTLKRICEMAGRFRRLARAKQRVKTSHGQDDMVGVVLGGEVARLLPHELAKLLDEDLEDDALRRLAERQALCRDYKGIKQVAKGPIVVVVDESGSMQGGKVIAAKGLALAMAWIARHQRRWVALVAFSGGTEGRTLAMPPGRWNEADLLVWLEEFLGGGTTIDVPLVELPTVYWDRFIGQGMTRGKTDIVCITDGIVDVPAGVAVNFLAWKAREKAKMTTLVIGVDSCGSLERVSDEVFAIPRIDIDQEAIGKVLGV